MTGVWFRATVRWCLRLLISLALVAAIRVAFVAWSQPATKVILTPVHFEESEDARQQQPVTPFGLDALRARLAAPPIPSDLIRDAVAGVAGGPSRPKVNQIYLVVNVQPDRSELLVNGIAQGHTPYLGEVSCQRGGTLSITVLPPTGMPKHFARACDRREIRIEE